MGRPSAWTTLTPNPTLTLTLTLTLLQVEACGQAECVDDDVWEGAAAQLLHLLRRLRAVLDALHTLTPLLPPPPPAGGGAGGGGEEAEAEEALLPSLVAHTLRSVQVSRGFAALPLRGRRGARHRERTRAEQRAAQQLKPPSWIDVPLASY